MKTSFSLLKKLIGFVGYRERVSSDNIFIVEIYSSHGVVRTRPNWALIIPLAVILLAAVASLSVFLYRRWRKNNCFPIYFAGKVKYARKGQTIAQVCDDSGWFSEDWVLARKRDITGAGHYVLGLFFDANCTIPFNAKKVVDGPIYIFPKIKK